PAEVPTGQTRQNPPGRAAPPTGVSPPRLTSANRVAGGHTVLVTSAGGTWPVHNTVPGSAGTVVQAGSIDGGVHLHPAPAPALPVPRQLPVVPDGFAGRSAQLDELDRL